MEWVLGHRDWIWKTVWLNRSLTELLQDLIDLMKKAAIGVGATGADENVTFYLVPLLNLGVSTSEQNRLFEEMSERWRELVRWNQNRINEAQREREEGKRRPPPRAPSRDSSEELPMPPREWESLDYPPSDRTYEEEPLAEDDERPNSHASSDSGDQSDHWSYYEYKDERSNSPANRWSPYEESDDGSPQPPPGMNEAHTQGNSQADTQPAE